MLCSSYYFYVNIDQNPCYPKEDLDHKYENKVKILLVSPQQGVN